MSKMTPEPNQVPTLLQSLRILSPDQTSSAASDSPRTVASSELEFSPVQESPMSEDLVIPKIEEHEDNDTIKLSPSNDDVTTPISARNALPRKRGRPRKNPVTQYTGLNKAPKGRSKTGCFTCRRRKKKCDEAKPQCLCCQKNNVECEGYAPKEVWKSGKQKAAEARTAPFDLPPLVAGIQDDLDHRLLEYFSTTVSRMLNLDQEERNPCRDLLTDMAFSHEGVMHSLLSLAGTHLLSGRHAQPQAEITNREQIEDRQEHHFKQANEFLSRDEVFAKSLGGDETAVVDDCTCAQVLILYMQSKVAGDTTSEHHIELQWAQHIMKKHPFNNKELQGFFYEFVWFHGISDSVISLDQRSILMMEDFELPHYMIQPEAGALLGVVGGLFGFISKTRQIRDRIRTRRSAGEKPTVTLEQSRDCHVIYDHIKAWDCNQEVGSPRYIASMLYRLTAWVYLFRTLLPSAPHEKLYDAVDHGCSLLNTLPSDSATYNMLLMPVFLLGCSAFEPHQRPDIVKGFENLQKYAHGCNVYYARAVVERVWELMDAQDDRSWDWESIIQERGWDSLIT